MSRRSLRRRRRRRYSVGQAIESWRVERVVAAREVLPAGARIIIHTVRPGRPDFGILNALDASDLPLAMHDALRGETRPTQEEIDAPRDPGLSPLVFGAWAVFDVEERLPAEEIVRFIFDAATPEWSFSIFHARSLLTVTELVAALGERIAQGLHDAILVPLDQSLETVADSLNRAGRRLTKGIGPSTGLLIAGAVVVGVGVAVYARSK